MNTSIVAYCCASRPFNNNSTLGGAIDAKTRAIFTELAAASAIEIVSSSAMDTQGCVVVGRLTANGPLVSNLVTLTGTTPVNVGSTFNRVLSVQLSSDAIGNVIVRKASAGTQIGAIPAGEQGFSALFIGSGLNRDDQVVYDKFFWKNKTGLALTVVQADFTVDAIGRMEMAVAAALNDTQSVADRLIAPTVSGQGFVGLEELLDVPDMANNATIGVWLKQTIPAGDVAVLSTFTARLGGVSNT